MRLVRVPVRHTRSYPLAQITEPKRKSMRVSRVSHGYAVANCNAAWTAPMPHGPLLLSLRFSSI